MPVDWSPDGKFLMFRSRDPKTGYDLWLLPMTGDRKPVPIVQTPFNDGGGAFSPDGKWIAYYSNDAETTNQIHAIPFPRTADRSQISVNGRTPDLQQES